MSFPAPLLSSYGVPGRGEVSSILRKPYTRYGEVPYADSACMDRVCIIIMSEINITVSFTQCCTEL